MPALHKLINKGHAIAVGCTVLKFVLVSQYNHQSVNGHGKAVTKQGDSE